MKLVKELSALRHREPALYAGTTRWEKHPELAIFTREFEGDRVTVYANFTDFAVSAPAVAGEVLISGNVRFADQTFVLSAGGFAAVKEKR